MSKFQRWSQPEIDALERLIGDKPWPEVFRHFQILSKKAGWPVRSESAILNRLHRTGQLAGARTGEETTTGGVALLLGCPACRVEAWLRRSCIAEILEPRWVGANRYIHRKNWRRLAHKMPRIFGGFSANTLFLLLEDRKLADSIAISYPRSIGDWRVRCVETGQIYASCGAVAEAYHVTQSTVSLAIRKGRPVRAIGLTFEALRKVARPSVPLQAGPIEPTPAPPLRMMGRPGVGIVA